MTIYYTVYQITNKVNGKIYIGAHKTEVLNDNYMGSGDTIKSAIKKYGVGNFEKQILFVADSEKEMFLKEAELVDDDFILREDTYNIIPGGLGWSGLGKHVTEQGIGIHALTFHERSCISKINQANRDPEERRQMCSRAGKIAGAAAVASKSGIHGLSAEHRVVNAKRGNDALREIGAGFFNPETQSELGKRGGPKNKGFVWYTDGKSSYKYTAKQQNDMNFDDFLRANPNFSRGRPIGFNEGNARPHIKGRRRFVTNGITNKQIATCDVELFLLNNHDFVLGKTNINRVNNRR